MCDSRLTFEKQNFLFILEIVHVVRNGAIVDALYLIDDAVNFTESLKLLLLNS